MTIKTATLITSVGVGIGTIIGVSYPIILNQVLGEINLWSSFDLMGANKAIIACRAAEAFFTQGSLLFFLVFLGLKQKQST